MSLLRAATAWLVEPADEPPLRLGGDEPAAPSVTAEDRPRVAVPAVTAEDRPRVAVPAATGGPFLAAEPQLRLASPLAAVAPAVPARVAVIGSGTTAPPLAAAVGLALRASSRAPAAIVALWRPPGIDGPPPGPSAPALPGAAALAGRLNRRDLTAVARGRLVWLLLPAAPDDAIPMLHHAEAAANGAPVVIVLARPREPRVDEVLAGCELAVVAALPGSPLAAVALDDAADLRIPAEARAPLPAGAGRLAALAGLATPLRRLRAADGQASILLIAVLAAMLLGVVVLGAAERAVGREGAAQRAADLAALAGARAMDSAYPRLFEPAMLHGRPNPRHLEVAEYLARGRGAALETVRRNGVPTASVSFPDGDSMAPVRIRVAVTDTAEVHSGHVTRAVALNALAVAELAPPGANGIPATAGSGYSGPLAYRQGKPMRPDTALAFDRMDRAARAAGVTLLITSALRTDAEQAVLWAQHPDPKWVAPPGTSLHRYGTELDLGPRSAYPWLAANARRFHFIQRYPNEPWHYGFTLNARSTSRGADGAAHRGLPDFVPARYAATLARAAQRWNVSATLLAAQIYAESGFNPFARSPVGALGIAQFMPGTAAARGLADPFDPEQAIDAQAHLMRDLLRRFAAVPLALAAYNAGELPVAACGCVPDFPETRAYVARILGLMAGAGDPLVPGTGLTVRLVR